MIDAGSLIKEINKGATKANAHFKKKGINAKAFNVDKVVIYKPRIIIYSDRKVMYKMPYIDNSNYFKMHDSTKRLALKWVAFYKTQGYL